MSNVPTPVRPKRLRGLALLVDQRQHAHADEIAAVDALEAFGDDGFHAEQERALGGPVARAAHAVIFAGEDDQRDAAPPGISSPAS